MGVGNEALISLIQDRIREQYGNPHAAARSIIRSLQLKGEKSVSEDTVARIYNRREDSSYMPKRESLLIIASELGIPVDDEQATLQYASEEAAKIINVCLSNYQNAETCMLLEQFARSLGKIERYYNGYARKYVADSSEGPGESPF